jgi:hypothetical protein
MGDTTMSESMSEEEYDEMINEYYLWKAVDNKLWKGELKDETKTR